MARRFRLHYGLQVPGAELLVEQDCLEGASELRRRLYVTLFRLRFSLCTK